MRSITRMALAGAISIAAVTAAAVPAFAATYPVPMSATIASAISITGLTPIAFGTVVPGNPATFVENYTVASNDAKGFTVQVADTGTPSGMTLQGGTANIPDADISDSNAQMSVSLIPGQQTVYTTSTGGGASLLDQWSLTIPSGTTLPGGTYSGFVTYTVTGNSSS